MCREIFYCALNFYHALRGAIDCAIDDFAIAKILKTAQNPADALIEAALDAGGKDNVSVIVAGVD